ncbi:MAG: hypothetical protein LAP85_25135 [Acidobacteriia bacterium]|nr:hypothetical protein [Terriglobia bacterium]
MDFGENGDRGYYILNKAGDIDRDGAPDLWLVGESGRSVLILMNEELRAAGASASLTVPPGGIAAISTISDADLPRVGYATAALNSDSPAVGIAVLRTSRDDVVVSEAAVPQSPPTTDALVFIEYRVGVPALPGRLDSGIIDINTGLAVVNCTSSVADVTYTLRDSAGNVLAMGHGKTAGKAHFALFIDQIHDLAPDFNLPSDFATTTQFATLEISSDQPLSILALRQTINQRGDILYTTTPIADRTLAPESVPIYFPQFVDGGGYTSTIMLFSTSNETQHGTIEILDDNGLPLPTKEAGGENQASLRYELSPYGLLRYQTDGSAATVKSGWVKLVPDAGTTAPVGIGVFGYNPAGVLVTESGVPASGAVTHARIHVDLSGGHDTGLALVNLVTESATVTVEAFQSDGSTRVATSSGTIRLVGEGHMAKFADQLIQNLPEGFTGVLDVNSSAPFAALTVRSLYNQRHDFLLTTFPIAQPYQRGVSQLLFPQIAAGGGFKTQFIWISPGAGSVGTISFHGHDGKPLAVLK